MDPRDVREQLRPQIKGHGAGWFVVGTPQVLLPPGRMQGAGGGPAGGAQQSTTAARDPAWVQDMGCGAVIQTLSEPGSGRMCVSEFLFLGFSLPSLGKNT